MATGLLLATVGVDLFSGTPRFTFGNINLYDGVEFLVLTLGLFAVGEVLVNLEDTMGRRLITVPKGVRNLLPNKQDLLECRRAIAQGSIVGFVIGAIPGGGSTIASFVSYTLAKATSRHPEKFGHGSMEGVAAPEAANNSEAGGAMVPLLSLGLPGSASTSVMLAALLLFGIQPGPRLFDTHPEIVWPVIASLYLGNFALLILNLPMIPIWVKLLKIPYWILYPTILVLAVVGAYSVRQSMFDIYLLIGFSALGYAFRRLEIPPAPLLMAFVLGPQAEVALRQSLILSDNNPLIFLQRPISATILGLTVVIVALAILTRRRAKSRSAATELPDDSTEAPPRNPGLGSDPAASDNTAAQRARAPQSAGVGEDDPPGNGPSATSSRVPRDKEPHSSH